MKEMLRYLRMKLQQERGEVSVEWALVAVIMAGVILTVFLPGVGEALGQAIDAIKAALTSGASGGGGTGGGA